MRGLSCSVVCWSVVSSMYWMVSPVKSEAKLSLFLPWAGLPIPFIKDSSGYRWLYAVPAQSLKHLCFLLFPLPSNTTKKEKRFSQSQWKPSAQEECPHACKMHPEHWTKVSLKNISGKHWPQLQPCTLIQYSKCWFFLSRSNGRDSNGIRRRKRRIKLNQTDGSAACLRIPHSWVIRALNVLKHCEWQWFEELIWLKTPITL